MRGGFALVMEHLLEFDIILTPLGRVLDVVWETLNITKAKWARYSFQLWEKLLDPRL